MKNGYKMDFIKCTLTITKEFERRAMDTNSEEYATLTKLRADFPNLRIVMRATPKRKRNNLKPTYDKMVNYLSCQTNSINLLNQFIEVKERSKSQENPYKFVRDWFLSSFPDFGELPKFKESEYPIAQRRITNMEITHPTIETEEVA